MILLLPPSETKSSDATGPIFQSSDLFAIPEVFPGISSVRGTLWNLYQDLLADQQLATRVLKLGKQSGKKVNELKGHSSVHGQGAWLRYTGVLYSAFLAQERGPQLSDVSSLDHRILVQSALFGLVEITDLIPNYRLSAGSIIGRPSIRELWIAAFEAEPPLEGLSGPLLDFRSNAYASLMPIPEDLASYSISVLDASSGRALSHFNKQSKGKFAGCLVSLISQERINGVEASDKRVFTAIVEEAALNAKLGVEILENRIQLRV